MGEKGGAGRDTGKERSLSEESVWRREGEEAGVPGRLILNDVNRSYVRSEFAALGWRALSL